MRAQLELRKFQNSQLRAQLELRAELNFRAFMNCPLKYMVLSVR